MNERLPFVTVVMPVRNEIAHIRRSLLAVLAQDYPADLLDIIVADGMSLDGTREIIQALSLVHSNIRLIDNPRQIAPTALNLAMAVAAGEIIVRVDGHCEIAADYVTNCVRHLLEDGVQGVGGCVETVGETDASRAIAAAMSSPFGVGGTAFRMVRAKTMIADTIPFPAYPRQVMETAGPYDETLVRDQDDEYNYRIRKLGGRLLLAEDVRSRYYSRASLSSLWRQYYGYGFWKARVFWRHPRQMRARQFVPAMFVASLGLCALLSPFSRRAGKTLLVVALAYLCASGLASAHVASRTEGQHMRWLPSAFAAMHFGYGAGFLVGNSVLLTRRVRAAVGQEGTGV